MKIIIQDIATGEIDINFEKDVFDASDAASFSNVYAKLMAALEGSIETYLKYVDAPDIKTFREHLYDILDAGFGNLLSKVFPEINVNEFNLSAAAMVYAQDQIIQKAEAEGKTYQEMLDEYEAIADKYIQEKRLS